MCLRAFGRSYQKACKHQETLKRFAFCMISTSTLSQNNASSICQTFSSHYSQCCTCALSFADFSAASMRSRWRMPLSKSNSGNLRSTSSDSRIKYSSCSQTSRTITRVRLTWPNCSWGSTTITTSQSWVKLCNIELIKLSSWGEETLWLHKPSIKEALVASITDDIAWYMTDVFDISWFLKDLITRTMEQKLNHYRTKSLTLISSRFEFSAPKYPRGRTICTNGSLPWPQTPPHHEIGDWHSPL